VSASAHQREDVAQIRAQANGWYERQVETCQRCLGSYWPEHEAWVRDYLKAELRERLIARGWRPIDGR
jgi:hypothetical protein